MTAGGTGKKIAAVQVTDAYITIAEAEVFAARVADVAAWEAASEDKRNRALVQASDEIDACPFDGIKYGDWRAIRPNVQFRAFPRILVDDPANWPAGKLQESAIIYDMDPVGNVIVPQKVKFAAFLQAMEILNFPDRKNRLRDREQGVTQQSSGSVSEVYDPAKPVKLICMEARLQLVGYFRKSGRLC